MRDRGIASDAEFTALTEIHGKRLSKRQSESSTDHRNNSIIRLKARADFKAAGESLRKSVRKRLF